MDFKECCYGRVCCCFVQILVWKQHFKMCCISDKFNYFSKSVLEKSDPCHDEAKVIYYECCVFLARMNIS